MLKGVGERKQVYSRVAKGAEGGKSLVFWLFCFVLVLQPVAVLAQAGSLLNHGAGEIFAVTLVPDPVYGKAPLTVSFTVQPRGIPNNQNIIYRWDFGDGEGTVGPPELVTHTYATPGSYVATVMAIADDGETAIGSSGIIVTP